MLPSRDKVIVDAAVKMRFNRDFPPMDGRMVTPHLKHNLMAIKMKMGMMTLMLKKKLKWMTIGRPASHQVEAHDRDYRTPRVPSPIAADRSVNVPEVGADAQKSDMFASAVSAEEVQDIFLPSILSTTTPNIPSSPVSNVPQQHAEAASMHQFHRRNGK
eukprot:353333-Amphidinium_carterae.1